jgi:hypothetical protein
MNKLSDIVDFLDENQKDKFLRSILDDRMSGFVDMALIPLLPESIIDNLIDSNLFSGTYFIYYRKFSIDFYKKHFDKIDFSAFEEYPDIKKFYSKKELKEILDLSKNYKDLI